jgi:copper chaperone CopZ
MGAAAKSASAGSSCSAKGAAAKSASAGSSCSAKGAAAQTAGAGSSCSAKGAAAQSAGAGSSCSAKGAAAKSAGAGSSCSAKGAAAQTASAGSSCSAKGTVMTTAAADGEYLIVYDVSGMTCGGCASQVQAAVQKLDMKQISAVEVDLEGHRAVIHCTSDDVCRETVGKAITEAGFPAELIVQAETAEDAPANS